MKNLDQSRQEHRTVPSAESAIIPKLDASLTCPFCQDTDFDAIGLKSHLSYGHCEMFEAVKLAARPPW